MIERLKYLPVNWVDGMKINKNHFVALQNYAADGLKDVRGAYLTPINYGLLPVVGNRQAVQISLSIDNHNLLRVHVSECHAVSPNGTRIEISSADNSEVNLISEYVENSFEIPNQKDSILYINISASAINSIPAGELDDGEQPPRYPYLLPLYQLSLVPDMGNRAIENTGSEVTIGQIVIKDGEPQLKQTYIPPSTIVNSHPALIQAFHKIDSYLGKLELLCVQICQKINRKGQTNDLSVMLLQLCENLIQYLGITLNQFRWSALYQAPFYMYEKPIAFARLMKNFVDSKSGAGKEELLNYFSEWCGLTQAEFETMFLNTVNQEYQHTDIAETNRIAMYFLENIENLFDALNKLDYIGRRRDTGIFVKERAVQDVNKGKRNRSFLDE